MSRFDLRDVSTRVTRSRDAKAVVFEFLRSLEAGRPEWRASLAFYEVSRDAFVDVLEVDDNRLIRREIVVSAKHLPDRLVRKLFGEPPGANPPKRKALFTAGLGTTPHYVAESSDAGPLLPLTVLSEWKSCICLPLGDQSDLMGILVLVSAKANAFGGRAISEILPVKSLVTMALAKHLRRAGPAAIPRRLQAEAARAASPAAPPAPVAEPDPAPAPAAPGHPAAANAPTPEEIMAFDAADEVASALRAELDDLAKRSRDAGEESSTEAAAAAAAEYQERQRELDEYRLELERVKAEMAALEAQAVGATELLTATYNEMNETSWQMADLERRVGFARRCLNLLGEEPSDQRVPGRFVDWLGEDLSADRCSLMTLDDSGEVLRIAAHRGIDAEVVGQVCVRVGQGVAGWVALNRKPLLVRMRSQADITPQAQASTYNSESFIAVPVVHNGRLYGVLNVSNKRDGELFNGVDFDCASLAGAALALRFSSVEAPGNGIARAA